MAWSWSSFVFVTLVAVAVAWGSSLVPIASFLFFRRVINQLLSMRRQTCAVCPLAAGWFALLLAMGQPLLYMNYHLLSLFHVLWVYNCFSPSAIWKQQHVSWKSTVSFFCNFWLWWQECLITRHRFTVLYCTDVSFFFNFFFPAWTLCLQFPCND